MSALPPGHPLVHEHANGTCPIAGSDNKFCPPQKGDIRSVCPALNTMANHGYIHRDGKNLSGLHLSRGLSACYGLSTPLALFLSYGGFLILHHFPFSRISLYDVNEHARIEHDASLVHHDTPKGQTHAPIDIDPELVDALFNDVQPTQSGLGPGEQFLIDIEDVARARVRREKECRPIGSIPQEIARGEMAIILGVFQRQTPSKTGAPVDYVRRWLAEERLPDGWRPDHTEGILGVAKRAKTIKLAADAIRAAEAEASGSKKQV